MIRVEGQHGARSYRAVTGHAIVVGAGPAGSVTALLLARSGLDVLLLDRTPFPRPKPCGDCLSAAATGLLSDLGLLDRVLDAGASRLSHWEIVAPDGTRATGRFGDATALALERRHLDLLVLQAAVEAGATFRQTRVTDLLFHDDRVVGVIAREPGGSQIRLRAPLVVGADGLRSVVSRKLGLVRRPPRLRKLSLTAHVAAPPGGMEHGEMHVIPDGCIGYAPSGDGRCNLTLVVSTDQAPRLRDEGPEAFFRGKLREAPGLPTDLGATGLGELLGSGPFDWPTRAPIAPGVALVGDAAGYYDPFTGQGMYQAMAGARLLARAVAPALTPRGSTRTSRVSHAGPLGDAGPVGRSGHAGHAVDAAVDAALDRYARQKQGLTRPARRLQHLVEAVLSRPQLADFALGRLSRARLAMDRLVEVTGDLRTPAALLSPRVLSSLILPPTQEAP